MIQSMRHIAQSWIVKALMAFLIVSFSIWGIGDIFRGNPLQKKVARIGSESITVQSLTAAFEESVAKLRAQSDETLTTQKAKRIGLLDKTLENEIHRILVDLDIAQLGINVPKDGVIKLIASQASLRNPDGTFNKELFRQLLQQRGLTEGGIVAQGQKDLSRQTLLMGLSGIAYAPQTQVDALFRSAAQKKVFNVLTFDVDKVAKVGTADERTLQEFHQANPQLFTAPEYRALTVATLSTDALEKDIKITDQQVQDYYSKNEAQLTNPETRDIIQVVTQDEAKAKLLASQAAISHDLAASAKLNKETPVPLNGMQEKKMMPELAKLVFALPNNGISEPYRTDLGWHIVQVKKITPPGKPAFDSIKETLRKDMRREQAIDEATRSVNQLDDELAAGHSLDDIADALKLRLVKVAAVDSSGLTDQGKEPSELPNKENIIRTAFGLSTGETGPVEDDKLGNYYVVRVDGVTPSALKPFAEVKQMVANVWKKQQALSKAREEAEAAAKALREGKPAAQIATKDGVTLRVSAPLSTLDNTDPQMPKEMVARVLGMRIGDATVETQTGSLLVVHAAKRVDGEIKADDPRKNLIANQLKRTYDSDILDQYMQHLYTQFPVKIDTALLDDMRGQNDNQP